ncbi:MAG: DUF4337 domain-containing protein [Gemmataceae bacterium]|nr:DUF4337 domain-containing protein [Gemmataceae bacterium]
MAEVEIPDPHETAEKAADPFARRVALFVAVYAVGLAVAALGGSNAAKEMMMAQQKATNLWAYYQAKVIRENLYLLEAEKLELDAEVRPPADRTRVDAVREKYRARAEKYRLEKEEIRAEAEAKERERDTAARRDPYFDFAEVTLQVAIVLASVAMLSGRRWAFVASLALAGVGLALTVNGFGLLVAVPGLE